jgi:hypothetical protein
MEMSLISKRISPMSIKLALAAVTTLLLTAQASAVTLAPPKKLNAILCKTEAQAVAFAANMAAGQIEPMAVNAVNKAAGAEVCGRYIGYAVVEIEKTQNHRGTLFMLAGLRFAEDGKLAWTASWVSPFNGALLERGA